VTERSEEVSFEDIGSQIAELATMPRPGEMGAFFGPIVLESPDLFAVAVIQPGADEVAMFANHYNMVVGPLVLLPDRDRHRSIIEDRLLSIRGFAVVIVAESSAQADHPWWQTGLAQNPAAFIQLMRAIIAGLAIAGGPLPVRLKPP